MDIRLDILPDSQPGYPAGFQLCQADPTSAADSSGPVFHRDQPESERGALLACVYIPPTTAGTAALARGGRCPARPGGAVPGMSRPDRPGRAVPTVPINLIILIKLK
jgi:hypothetical protein